MADPRECVRDRHASDRDPLRAPEWFKPLFAELDRRGLPYEKLDATRLVFDPDDRSRPLAGRQPHEPVRLDAWARAARSSTRSTTSRTSTGSARPFSTGCAPTSWSSRRRGRPRCSPSSVSPIRARGSWPTRPRVAAAASELRVPRPREAEHRRQRRRHHRVPVARRARRSELRPGPRRHAARPGAAACGRGRDRSHRDPRRRVPLRDPDPAPARQLQPLPGRLLRAARSGGRCLRTRAADRGVRAAGGGGRGTRSGSPGRAASTSAGSSIS